MSDRPPVDGADEEAVARLLGRRAQGAFAVVVRGADGGPVVIRNAPLLDDGRPMPTRHWLVGAAERRAVSRLEAAGGVSRAEAAVPAAEVEAAHRRAAAERDAAIPPGWSGPRPSGGVGGTRTGVKCLHCHYADHLAGTGDPVGRWVADQLAGREAPGSVRRMGAVAAVDCGPNSTRLLVVDGEGRPVERLMRITRLGQGVDAGRRLQPEAVARVVAVLGEFREVLDRHRVERVRVAATSAARDAANRDELFDAAEAVLGTRPELLDGVEEARLSFAGATAGLPPGGPPLLVADIGGGSTELVVGVPGEEPAGAISLDVGCVRLTERWIEHDPASPEELANALGEVRDVLEDADRQVPALAGAGRLVGLAGTVSALASLDLGLATYDREKVHHHVLSRPVVEDWFRTMAMGDRDDRLGNPGLEEGRADVIVGGLCVLVSILRHRGFDSCLVSESDILDGLCLRPADH